MPLRRREAAGDRAEADAERDGVVCRRPRRIEIEVRVDEGADGVVGGDLLAVTTQSPSASSRSRIVSPVESAGQQVCAARHAALLLQDARDDHGDGREDVVVEGSMVMAPPSLPAVSASAATLTSTLRVDQGEVERIGRAASDSSIVTSPGPPVKVPPAFSPIDHRIGRRVGRDLEGAVALQVQAALGVLLVAHGAGLGLSPRKT